MLFKHKPSPFIQAVIIIVCIFGSLYFIKEIINVTGDTFTFIQQIREYKAKKEALQDEHDELIKEVSKLQDNNYIENLVRAKYNITKEGEAIFHLPSSGSGN